MPMSGTQNTLRFARYWLPMIALEHVHYHIFTIVNGKYLIDFLYLDTDAYQKGSIEKQVKSMSPPPTGNVLKFLIVFHQKVVHAALFTALFTITRN